MYPHDFLNDSISCTFEIPDETHSDDAPVKAVPAKTVAAKEEPKKEAAPAKKEKDSTPLTDKHPKWAAAKKALANGQVTMEKIKENYMISAKYEKLLKAK